MSDEWIAFTKDSRPICKYGVNCYQKNPEHHKTLKHPPRTTKMGHTKRKNIRKKPYSRESTADKNNKNVISQEEMEKGPNCNEHNSEPSSCQPILVEEIKNVSVNIPKSLSFYSENSNSSLLKELFLVNMPQDFFKFFECFNDDQCIVKTLNTVNLELIGPYELLLGKLPILEDKELYLVHWRFFFDPPEFQSVLKKKGKSQYHIGYYRDNPDEMPQFLASNDSEKGYQITPLAENIFAATYLYLLNEKKSSPFTAMACQKLIDKIKKYAEENNYTLEEFNMKKRQSKIVTATLHRAGIVVPYDKKTQLGYRPLAETDTALKIIFKNLEKTTNQKEKDKLLSDLQPVITFASIAMDECDFGTGLEAGIDLFCSGLKELEPSALSSLCVAYSLLKREAYSKIIQAHIKYRRRGPNMSILSINDN